MSLTSIPAQAAIAAVICLISILGLKTIAPKLKLVAHPGEHRHHQSPTPMVGGLAIFIASFIALSLFGVDSDFAILACCLMICIVGVLDDAFQLSAILRFAIQAGIACLMIQLTGASLETLGELVSQHELSLGRWRIPLTIFATVGVINAINMSDGMDGLVGSLVSISLFAFLLLGADQSNLLIVFLSCLIVFLGFNSRLFVKQARIYLGDGGSNLLGLLLAYLFIKNSQGVHAVIHPVTALWFMALPLIDTVSVMIVRPLRGNSPFSADRIHYHHQLLERGFSVNQTLLFIVLAQSSLVILGLLLQNSGLPQSYSFYSFLTLFFAYLIFLFCRTGKQR